MSISARKIIHSAHKYSCKYSMFIDDLRLYNIVTTILGPRACSIIISLIFINIKRKGTDKIRHSTYTINVVICKYISK